MTLFKILGDSNEVKHDLQELAYRLGFFEKVYKQLLDESSIMGKERDDYKVLLEKAQLNQSETVVITQELEQANKRIAQLQSEILQTNNILQIASKERNEIMEEKAVLNKKNEVQKTMIADFTIKLQTFENELQTTRKFGIENISLKEKISLMSKEIEGYKIRITDLEKIKPTENIKPAGPTQV